MLELYHLLKRISVLSFAVKCFQPSKKIQELSPSLIMLAFLHYMRTADNLYLDKKLLLQFQNTRELPDTERHFHY